MARLLQLTINLSATLYNGRYVLNVRSYPLNKETEKTLVITDTLGKERRLYKTELLSVYSDYAFQRLDRMQFGTWALENDLEKAKERLIASVTEAINAIRVVSDNALAAFGNGLEINNH